MWACADINIIRDGAGTEDGGLGDQLINITLATTLFHSKK